MNISGLVCATFSRQCGHIYTYTRFTRALMLHRML
jgi:hypothetical protein